MYQNATNALKQIKQWMEEGKYGGPGVFSLKAEDGREFFLGDACNQYEALKNWQIVDKKLRPVAQADLPLVEIDTTCDALGGVYCD